MIMYKINNSRELSWEVKISWSKNAALPLIAASLLIRWKVRFTNMPHISDVETFLEIISSMWISYKFENNILEVDSTNLSNFNINFNAVWKIRASILLLSPVLHFFGKITMPFPWGCVIWQRPVDTHLNWLKVIWYNSIISEKWIEISGKSLNWDLVVNWGFSVTPTENLIIANVLRQWKTKIVCSAIEPHVICLIEFFKKAWANISIDYDHSINIIWVDQLKSEVNFEVIHDYLESGAFMIIWALCAKEFIDIKNARIKDLSIFIEKLKEAWVKVEDLWNDKLRVFKATSLKGIQIQTNIFPWFPTDLQSPFAILQSQADWISKIHEVLFEWRLNFLVELDKMRWHTALLNPHEAMIFGKTDLRWATVTSWDLRAWAAMVIAWLIANWETKVTNIEYIERWYEKFVEKLKAIWARIEKV